MPIIKATAMTGKVAILAAFAAAPVLMCAVAHAEPVPAPGPDSNVPAVPGPDPNAPVVPVVDPVAVCSSPEFGGLFVPDPAAPEGVARGACQYIVEGKFYYDNYENGVYTGTLVFWDGEKRPTERPALPETIPGMIPGGGVPTAPFFGGF